ncbi:MAG: hypothetical protein JJD97_02430 [Gemmatimonadaceae bacterium]|nr:hypothetical protein [Gemmatimonadaceae bacterium]
MICAALAACSAHDSNTAQKAKLDSIANAIAKIGDTANPYLHAVAHKYGPPTGKIRIANLFEANGRPGGPIDVYDVRTPDSATVPLIKRLAYGEISAYVSPRAGDNYAGSPSQLYAFPADTKQPSPPFGSNLDNSGFNSTDQITMALGPSHGFGGSVSMAEISVIEAGKRISPAESDTANAIPAGQGLLVVREANMNVDSMPEQYLMVDGTCPHAPNDRRVVGDTLSFKKEPSNVSTTLYFPIAPGTHTLGVVTSPRGQGLLNCDGKTPGQTTSVSVEAGHRYIAWVYGQPSDGLRVVAAPIAAP